MGVVRYDAAAVSAVRAGVARRLGYGEKLMMTVIDFDDGPQDAPDPPHAHPHEQASYVAEGEILFFLDGQPERLGPGDLFLVPPGVPHSIQLLARHVRLVDCFTPIRDDFIGR
ncbi:MAG: cupin domain-containing protein [Anaerolineae bacterium]|nr:cupin domain-containing protein [Anaerolineae bacterium]